MAGDNFWDLYEWSITHVCEFWGEIWDMLKLIHSKPYEKVTDLSVKLPDQAEWFPGVRLNYAENLLRYRDEHIAIIATGEERETKMFTYAEVYVEACRYGAALRKLGIRKNDHAVCYMPNREEAIFAMIATTSIGAIWSGALPLYGANAVVNRFKQTKPKILFTIDRFPHNSENVEMLEKIREIVNELPSLEKIVIIPWSESSLLKDISEIRNSCFLKEFLSLGQNPNGSTPELEFEQLPFNHPISINYTSGTTGSPKAVMHGFGGFFSTARDFWLHNHTNRDLTWLSLSPVGWLSWNILASFLILGYTLVVYEGVPFFKSPTALWDVIDKFNITDLFLSSSILDTMEKMKLLPGKMNHLTSLKRIMAAGSIVKPQNFDFVFKHFKDLLFRPCYGCTEIAGFCIECDRTLPIYRGELSTLALGMDVSCYDDFGKPVVGEMGEVVIRNNCPSFPLGLWGDEDGALYKKTYFSRFPGVFTTSDFAIVNPITRGTVICCRSDDTLKPKGYRFGSSEIYNIVDLFPEVVNCLCVSQYNKDGDERAVLFLKMAKGHVFTEDLVQNIRDAIEREMAVNYVPEVIVEVPDVPMNMNGKKMEITVKRIINRLPYNAETVENHECLKHFEKIPELQNY